MDCHSYPCGTPAASQPTHMTHVAGRCAVNLAPSPELTPSTRLPAFRPHRFAAAKYPEHQERLAQEVRQAGVLDALKAGTLTNEQLASLPFLDSFIKETQRLWPTAAIATSRVVPGPGPATVGGVRVPPGTVVWVLMYALHNSERLWDRPQEFDPSRWVGCSQVSEPGVGARCWVSEVLERAGVSQMPGPAGHVQRCDVAAVACLCEHAPASMHARIARCQSASPAQPLPCTGATTTWACGAWRPATHTLPSPAARWSPAELQLA